MAEKEYIERENALWLVYSGKIITGDNSDKSARELIESIPAADVRPNDARLEFIKYFEGFPAQVIAMAFAYADCLTKYGVDVSAQWQTVTAQRDALNRAYMQGRADEAERWSRREAEEGET